MCLCWVFLHSAINSRTIIARSTIKGLYYCASVGSFELNDSFPKGDIGSKSVFGRGGVLDDLSLGSLGSHDLGTSKSSSAAKYQAYSSSYR